jgi:aromatic-L-amino-acid decarboxylase
VESSPILKLVTPPSLSLNVFRIFPEATKLDEKELDPINRRFFERISFRNDILVTQTLANGIFGIRLAVGAKATQSRHVKAAYDLFVTEAEETLVEWKEGKILRHE